MKKNNSLIYILLLSVGFLFFMIGALFLISIVLVENSSLLIIAFVSEGIGVTLYLICFIVYLVRRKKK